MKKEKATHVAIALHGFVGENHNEARRLYLQYEAEMFKTGSTEIGRLMSAPAGREADLKHGMVFAGGPNEVADRITHLH